MTITRNVNQRVMAAFFKFILSDKALDILSYDYINNLHTHTKNNLILFLFDSLVIKLHWRLGLKDLITLPGSLIVFELEFM